MTSSHPEWNPNFNPAGGHTSFNVVGERIHQLLYNDAAPYLEERKAALEQMAILQDLNERHGVGVTALQVEGSRLEFHWKALEPVVSAARRLQLAVENASNLCRETESGNDSTATTIPVTKIFPPGQNDSTSPTTSAYTFHNIALEFENPVYPRVLELRAHILAEEDILRWLMEYYCTLEDGGKANITSSTPDTMISSFIRDTQEAGRRIFEYKFKLHRLLRQLQLPIQDEPSQCLASSSSLPATSSSPLDIKPTATDPPLLPAAPSRPPPEKAASKTVPALSATSVCPPSSSSSSGKHERKGYSNNTSSLSPSFLSPPPPGSNTVGEVIPSPPSRLSPRSALKVQFPQASEKLIDKVLTNCGSDPVAAKKKMDSLCSQ